MRNLLLVVGSVVFSLLLLEAGLRALDLFPPSPSRVEPCCPDLYQPDEIVGYRLWRSTETHDRYPTASPQVTPIVSNSDGFRSHREFDEFDSRLRILVVGDSFVFGMGVRAEERLTEVLESIEPSWRVDNLGISGWGLDLMIRGLEYIGPKASPDIIVFAVYTDQFRRLLPYYAGIGYRIPKYALVDDRLVTEPYPSATWWRRKRIAQAIYEVQWKLRDRNRYELNRVLLERFYEIAEQLGSQPVVLFLPGRGDTKEDRARREFLQDWASSRQVPYRDLTDPLHSVGVNNTYIAGDYHWNANGHRIAAEKLRDLIIREVTINPGLRDN